jgi:hypothetical protein
VRRKEDLIQIERVVVVLAQLDLPSGNAFHVVEQVFEDVEVHQRAFDFIKLHLAYLADAADGAEQSWALASAVWAGSPGEAAFGDVSGAVAEDDGAARIKRSEDDLARVACRHGLACAGIDDLDEGKLWAEVEAAGADAEICGALGKGHLGFREAVGADDADIIGTEIVSQHREPCPHAFGDFFATEHDAAELRPVFASLSSLTQHVIEEGGHADDDLGPHFFDEGDVSLRAHDLATARADHEGAEAESCMMGLPEGEVRGIGEAV